MTTDLERLNRLADALAEDVLSMTDEEILKEAAQEGIDLDELQAKFKGILARAVGAP